MRRFTLALAAVVALSPAFMASPVQAAVSALTLTQAPAGPLMAGEKFTLGGESATADPVTLELDKSGTWSKVATVTPVAAGAGTARKDFVDYGTDGHDITKSVVICADCKKVRRFGK